MKQSLRTATIVALAAIVLPAVLLRPGKASDHADTPDIAKNPGFDITDVFLFPSPTNPDNVVLAMNVHPLITPNNGTNTVFDPNVLYQFKIDNTGDYVEDLVIQAQFSGTGPDQTVRIAGPVRPRVVGTRNMALQPTGQAGMINTTFNVDGKTKVFAGGREDPFFFDLEQFFNILPDRATPLTGVDVPNPNAPQAGSFRPPGQAVDFLSNGGYNVLSVIIELPRKQLLHSTELPKNGKRSNVISVWCTTSSPDGNAYQQVDRLARPAINEVFATVANNRHKINDESAPTDDINNLKNDMESFLVFPANRSPQIRAVLEAVLVPDVLKADLGSMDKASYLGYETGGATGGKFGGRALADDVVDISLGAIFGNTVPALGLAPDDGHEIPGLTTDNVGPEGKHFLSMFPYMGNPTTNGNLKPTR